MCGTLAYWPDARDRIFNTYLQGWTILRERFGTAAQCTVSASQVDQLAQRRRVTWSSIRPGSELDLLYLLGSGISVSSIVVAVGSRQYLLLLLEFNVQRSTFKHWSSYGQPKYGNWSTWSRLEVCRGLTLSDLVWPSATDKW
jgi:hypothetical protein